MTLAGDVSRIMCMNFMCQDLAWGCVQWCFELAVHGDDVMVFSDGRRGLKVGADEKASGSLPNQGRVAARYYSPGRGAVWKRKTKENR